MPVKSYEESIAFGDLGSLNFQNAREMLWIHRYGQGHDDLMIKYSEIPKLVKKLKKIYKWSKKHANPISRS